MRKIILASISILIFCLSLFAQTGEISPCPKIIIATPSGGNFTVGELLVFTANVNNDNWNKFTYDWSISNGEIIEGQGSPSISVFSTDEMNDKTLKISVEVKGLPKNCPNIASENLKILFNEGTPISLDNYKKISFEEETKRLNYIVNYLKKHKQIIALFIIKFTKENNTDDLSKRLSTISKYLIEKGLAEDKFRFILSEIDEYKTRIYAAPITLAKLLSWEKQIEPIEKLRNINQSTSISKEKVNTKPCPTLSVTGPSEPFIPNKSQTQTFTANLDYAENYQIEYKWTINGGVIIEGQGTSIITVFQPSTRAGGNVTATLEIRGNFPSYCGSSTASETAMTWDPPNVIQIDGFSGSLSEVKNKNLDNFARQLKENPTSQGNIIWYSKRNLSKKIVEQAIQQVTEYLTKEQKIDKARITIQTLLFDEDFVEFFIVPAGASPPTP